MPKQSPEMRALVSANVRKALVLQDLSTAHLMQVLDMSQSGVAFKLSNRDGNHFSDEQIIKLAKFLAIPIELLTSPNLSDEMIVAGKHMAPKFNKSEQDSVFEMAIHNEVSSTIPMPVESRERNGGAVQPPKQEEAEEKEDIIQELIDHVDLGSDSSEVGELKIKIFQATLTGRIPNIVPFLGNSLLATALRTYRKKHKISTPIDITEEQQTQFIGYYKEQYENWKKTLWPEADKEIELILVNNKHKSIASLVRMAIQMPETSVNDMVDQCLLSGGWIDVQRLSDLLNMMIEDLMHIKKPLDGYLYEQLNVSGS